MFRLVITPKAKESLLYAHLFAPLAERVSYTDAGKLDKGASHKLKSCASCYTRNFQLRNLSLEGILARLS